MILDRSAPKSRLPSAFSQLMGNHIKKMFAQGSHIGIYFENHYFYVNFEMNTTCGAYQWIRCERILRILLFTYIYLRFDHSKCTWTVIMWKKLNRTFRFLLSIQLIIYQCIWYANFIILLWLWSDRNVFLDCLTKQMFYINISHPVLHSDYLRMYDVCPLVSQLLLLSI